MISAVDETISATEHEAHRLAAVLKIRRAALTNDASFTEVPAHTAFDIRLGRQRSPERANGPSMTPYLRSGNVGYDSLRLDDILSMDFNERERERYALASGDVLVSEGSAGADAVGMPAAWNAEIEGPVCFQNTLLRYRSIVGVSTPAFMRHWCLWAYESGTFRNAAPDGVNIKHIGDKRANAMPVRLPDTDAQEAIVAELEPLSEAVASLRAEAARLQTTRAALLNALLTRKVEISTPIV
ncbi:restriction endonuclease subunit S domain-containing protein [Arthrobacter sp. TMS2-4]